MALSLCWKKTAVTPAYVYLAAFLVFALFMPVKYLVVYTPDDAWFYPRISAQAWMTGLVSFDGINPTTGFHPLWFLALHLTQLPLVPLGLLGSSACTARLALTTEVFCICAWLFMADRCLRLAGARYLPRLIALLYAAALSTRYGMLMETSVLLFAAFLLLDARLGAVWGAKQPNFFLAGFLITIARVDYAAVACGVGVAWLLLDLACREARPNALRRFGAIVVGALAAMATTALFNYLVCGSFVSTSASLKAYAPGESIDFFDRLTSWEFGIPAWTYFFGLLLVSAIAAAMAFLRRRRRANLMASFALFQAAVLTLLLLHFCLNALPGSWYRRPGHTLLAISLGLAVPAFPGLRYMGLILRRRLVLQVAMGTVAAVALLGWIAYTRHYPVWSQRLIVADFANTVKENTTPADVIFAEDYSGIISFFSERTVVNGDGLVNSPVYTNEFLAKGRVAEYLNSIGANYYVTTRLKRNVWRVQKDEALFRAVVKPFFLDVPESAVMLRSSDFVAAKFEGGLFFSLYKYRPENNRGPAGGGASGDPVTD